MKRKDFIGHKTRQGYCRYCAYYGATEVPLSSFHLTWQHGIITEIGKK